MCHLVGIAISHHEAENNGCSGTHFAAYETSRHRLIMTDLPEIPDHYTDVERTLHISSKISFDSIATVRASGGLMKLVYLLTSSSVPSSLLPCEVSPEVGNL